MAAATLGNSTAWTGKDHLYFTTSFWWRADIISRMLFSEGHDHDDLLELWVDIFGKSVLLIWGLVVCYIAWRFTILKVTDESETETADVVKTVAELRGIAKSNDEEVKEVPHTYDVLPTGLSPFTSRVIGLLQIPIHDLLFFLTRRVSGRDLMTQIATQFFFNCMLSPLHALHTQGTIVKNGEVLPHLTWKYYRGLVRLLLMPTMICSLAKSIAISITLSCLRSINDRPFAEVQMLEIIGFIVVVLPVWVVLVSPVSIARIFAELSLLPDEINTIKPIHRSGLSQEVSVPWRDTQDSAHLLFWSWQFVTIRKVILYSDLMSSQVVAAALLRP